MFGPKTLWKLPTLQKLAKQAHFEVLHKKLKKTHVVFDKESKNGLCFEIKHVRKHEFLDLNI